MPGVPIKRKKYSAIDVASVGSNNTQRPMIPKCSARRVWRDSAKTLMWNQRTSSCWVSIAKHSARWLTHSSLITKIVFIVYCSVSIQNGRPSNGFLHTVRMDKRPNRNAMWYTGESAIKIGLFEKYAERYECLQMCLSICIWFCSGKYAADDLWVERKIKTNKNTDFCVLIPGQRST